MGQGPIQAVESALANAIHHTRNAIDAAVVKAKADAESEKIKIAADVRSTVAAAKVALTDAAPEIEAALKKGAETVESAVEAILKARGL